MRVNVPVLAEEEVWSRNQYFKHWGHYKTFRFRKGKPAFVLASYFTALVAVLVMTAFPIITIKAWMQSRDQSITPLALQLVTYILNLYLLRQFISVDPGIASFSLPIINEEEVAAYKNFCLKCKCIQNQQIKHCPQCDVCIKQTIFHSKLTSTCISPTNVGWFCAVWLSLTLSAVLSLSY